MNLTINNINTNPLATLLFRDGQGILLAGLSLILRSRAIKSAWLQFREKDAPKPVQVIAGANIRRPVAGKNVIRAGGRPAFLIVPAKARVLRNPGGKPSLGRRTPVRQLVSAAPFIFSDVLSPVLGLWTRRSQGSAGVVERKAF